MEVHFTSEQEEQLSQIATNAGTDAEQLVKAAALRLLEQDAHFRATVREGIAQADRAISSKKKKWTPAAAADLEHSSNHLNDRHPRHRLPTMRKLYEAVRSLKQWPNRGRAGREEGTRELLFPPCPISRCTA